MGKGSQSTSWLNFMPGLWNNHPIIATDKKGKHLRRSFSLRSLELGMISLFIWSFTNLFVYQSVYPFIFLSINLSLLMCVVSVLLHHITGDGSCK